MESVGPQFPDGPADRVAPSAAIARSSTGCAAMTAAPRGAYIAHSYQDDASPLPYGAGVPWRPWSVRHEFIASVADQGALIRVRACYTPIRGCDRATLRHGSHTRINVLQQSRCPRSSADLDRY